MFNRKHWIPCVERKGEVHNGGVDSIEALVSPFVRYAKSENTGGTRNIWHNLNAFNCQFEKDYSFSFSKKVRNWMLYVQKVDV